MTDFAICHNILINFSSHKTNNDDLVFKDYEVKNEISIEYKKENADNITATRFIGKIDCGMIDGGSDSNYCADAGGGFGQDSGVAYSGGNSTFGGAGGGGGDVAGTPEGSGGHSIFGGNGGKGNTATTEATAGTQP